jgi:hypothetical protein
MTEKSDDFLSLSAKIQAAVDEEVSRVAPTEWDENHLSFLVVRSIRRTLAEVTSVTHNNGVIHLCAEAYKLTGTPERTHGDIAIAIQHVFGSGHEIRGLGFYEAKASDDWYRYPAFKFRQLQRLAAATPRLSYLFYDRHAEPACDNPFAINIDHNSTRPYRSRWPSVHARAVGANIIRGVRDPVTAARIYAEPFGYHLVARYFTGRDLDFSRPPADTLKRWLDATKRSPPIVIALAISELGSPTVQLQLPGFEVHQLPVDRLRPLLKNRAH